MLLWVTAAWSEYEPDHAGFCAEFRQHSMIMMMMIKLLCRKSVSTLSCARIRYSTDSSTLHCVVGQLCKLSGATHPSFCQLDHFPKSSASTANPRAYCCGTALRVWVTPYHGHQTSAAAYRYGSTGGPAVAVRAVV